MTRFSCGLFYCFVSAVVALLWCFHRQTSLPAASTQVGSKLADAGWWSVANPQHTAPLTTQTLQDRPTPQSCCERYVEQCRPAFWPAVCTICVSARALCNLHVAFLDIHNVLRPEPLNMAILVHNKYCILCNTQWLSEALLVLLTLYWYHCKFNHYASSSDCHIVHNEHIIAQMYFGSFIFVQCIDNLPPIIHSWSVYLYISLSSCTIW